MGDSGVPTSIQGRIQQKTKGEGHRVRLVVLYEGRSTDPEEGMGGVSLPFKIFFINKHVNEALIEHPMTRNDTMEDPTTSSDGTVCW